MKKYLALLLIFCMCGGSDTAILTIEDTQLLLQFKTQQPLQFKTQLLLQFKTQQPLQFKTQLLLQFKTQLPLQFKTQQPLQFKTQLRVQNHLRLIQIQVII